MQQIDLFCINNKDCEDCGIRGRVNWCFQGWSEQDYCHAIRASGRSPCCQDVW